MIRRKPLSLSPYKLELYVYTGGTWAEARDEMHRRGLKFEADDDPCIGRTIIDADGVPDAMWIRNHRNAPTVAHEAMHLAGFTLLNRGMELTVETTEAYSYLIEDIVRQVMSNKGWK